ncbi:hypothetical protein AHIS1_p028 [Acaryochloris phage A-HIS1]|nr:hypothetical protein AHIS1_p028 [Acaryochloris phage A-HIS1]
MRTLDLTINNEVLSRLQKKRYEKPTTAVPNKALAATPFGSDLALIYEALTGNTMNPEGNTFTVRANNGGGFSRLYAPAVYNENDTLVIRWGSEYIPFTFVESGGKRKKYSLWPANETAVSKEDLELTFAKIPFGLDGFDPCLKVSLYVEAEQDTITVEFPVWCADNKNKPSDDLLNEKLLRNPTELMTLIAAPPVTFDGPTYSFRNEDETHLGEYTVTSYRSVETAYGTNFIMVVDVTNDDRYEVDAFETWSPNTDVKNMLISDPVITAEAPAKLVVSNRQKYTTKAKREGMKIEACLLLDEAANAVDESDDLLSGW